MRFPLRVSSDDRGAILIYVALAIAALVAVSTFVVDLGAFWVARGQAQNAADAAAHAGAVAIALDPSADPDDSALEVLRRSRIWGRLLDPAGSVQPPTIVKGQVTCPDSGSTQCYRVDVTWDYVPVFFGGLVGQGRDGRGQTVRATATAEVKSGNMSRCLKPWAIPDLWENHSGLPTKFDNNLPGETPDSYRKPTAGDQGTGYRVTGSPNDFGREFVIRPWCTAGPCQASSLSNPDSGRFLPVNPVPGCPSYADSVTSCGSACGARPAIDLDAALPFVSGNFATSTKTNVDALIAKDQYATFDASTGSVTNSCVQYNATPGDPRACPAYNESPRVVAVPAYDPDVFESNRAPGQPPQIRLTNILSVFIESVAADGAMTVAVIRRAGEWNGDVRELSSGSAFAPMVVLVR